MRGPDMLRTGQAHRAATPQTNNAGLADRRAARTEDRRRLLAWRAADGSTSAQIALIRRGYYPGPETDADALAAVQADCLRQLRAGDLDGTTR